MKFYFDENFPKHIVEGLRSFQAGRLAEGIDLVYIPDICGRGAKDEEIIPVIAKESGILITHDISMKRSRMLGPLLEQCRVSAFFFQPPRGSEYKYWQMVELVVQHWCSMKSVALEKPPPFSYAVRPRSKQPIDLDADRRRR